MVLDTEFQLRFIAAVIVDNRAAWVSLAVNAATLHGDTELHCS